MNPVLAILIIVGFIEIVFGFFIFARDRRNIVNIAFLLLSLSAASWSFTRAIFEIVSLDWAVVIAQYLYISASFTASTFLFLTLVFPSGLFQKKYLLIFLLNILAVWTVFLPRFVISDVVILTDNLKVNIFGPGYAYYFIYLLSYVIWASVNLIKNYWRSTGLERVQMKYVLVGTLVPGFLGVTTNLILPTFGVFKYFELGPIFIAIFIVSISYAIVKHHLLNMKVIATEITVTLLSFFLLINVFASGNISEFIIRAGLFLVVSVIGVFLIRSVLKEVRAREEIQKLALQLEKANLELRQLDKTKSEFISIASHQLRTPLTVIKGYISMIQEGTFGNVPTEVTDALKKVYTSNERLIHLVNDLLDISRIERGKMEYEMKPQSAVALLDGAVEELTPRAKEAGLALELKLPPESLPQINADGEKLHQVFVNIIDNAIKYTERGGVVVSAEPQGKNIIFKFQDTGMGLTDEDLSHLFLRFVRGHRTSRLHANGTGLGLYVAKKIIDAHHGRVWAESEGKDKGSAFYVSLPILRRK